MKWRTLFILLAVIPAVMYGGLRAFLWYSINDRISEIQRRVAQAGHVTYREIRTPVLGPIGVSGIAYTPQGLSESVEIGSVLAHWKEPLDLFDLIQAFYKNQLPKRLKLSINQIKIPLDGEIATWWDKQARWSSFIPVNIPDAALGCGSGRFYATDFRNMGYESLVSNARFEYNLPPRSNKVLFYASVRNLEMASISVEGSIPLKDNSLFLNQLLTTRPVLANASITLDDGSYNKRKITYCAAKLGIPEDEYVDYYLQRIASDLDGRSLPPSPELTGAVRAHLMKDTNVTVNVNPYEPLGPDTLAQLNQENFSEWLGLEVISGDKLISAITAPVQLKVVEEETQTPKQHQEKFNPIPTEQLTEHLGQLARIQTKDGVLKGYLEQVDAGEATLTQSLSGGSFTFVVKLTDIRAVSVFY